ncbi:B-box zinc finger protein 22 [Rhodamnia argentea]|uniref:B-box zinc finger protein 22 n=1 Tax=Rhodamnia argentea TaxID=178133 RepID=A0A8B8N2G7_9MYRT|nr:B-box zinc finger protein 22 [Rhodamnia argentea]XP_048129585.1 B-box zinc finger protein 22 [Rhodamnia argentea]
MKIQCNVCEAAEASVLCCADEAALCWACDEKVHAANKLAGKHQRVPLSTSALQMPKCDICQETAGFFFCLEDRALLCRKCDVAIHTANTYVSAHQRFLLTGVKVGLEPTKPHPSSSSINSQPGEKISETKTKSSSLSKGGTQLPLHNEYNDLLPVHTDGVEGWITTKLPFSGGSAAASMPQWHLDELLGFSDFNQSYRYMGNGSSKADSGKLGGSDCSSIMRSSEETGDECLGEVPDAYWAVPQMSSPPTASGLYWPKSARHQLDAAVYVPDISSAPENDFLCQRNDRSLKRRRQT